jgi:hypothetical protein
MGKQLKRMPRWLSVDLTILAVSLIIIAVGVWMGIEVVSELMLVLASLR